MPLIHVSFGKYKHVDLSSAALNVPSRSRSNLSTIQSRSNSILPKTHEPRPQTISTGQLSSVNLDNNPRILSTHSSLNNRQHVHSGNAVIPLDISMTSDGLSRTKSSSTRLISSKSTVTHSKFHLSVKGSTRNITNTKVESNQKNRKRKPKYPNSKCCLASLLLSILAVLLLGGIATGITLALVQRTTSPVSVTTTRTSTTTTTVTTTTTSITSTTTTRTTTTTGSSSISTSVTNSAHYAERRIQLACTVPLTNLTIQTIVQKTVGATYSGAWSTISGATITQSYVDNGSEIIYKWTIVNGQTISCPGSYPFVAQFGLSGTAQPNGIDSYIVTTVTNLGGISAMTGFF